MQIYSCALRDKHLSLRARGLHALMRTFPDGWKFYADYLAKYSNTTRYVVDEALKELEKRGYIERIRQRGEDGRFRGYLYLVYPVRLKVFARLTREMEDEK